MPTDRSSQPRAAPRRHGLPPQRGNGANRLVARLMGDPDLRAEILGSSEYIRLHDTGSLKARECRANARQSFLKIMPAAHPDNQYTCRGEQESHKTFFLPRHIIEHVQAFVMGPATKESNHGGKDKKMKAITIRQTVQDLWWWAAREAGPKVYTLLYRWHIETGAATDYMATKYELSTAITDKHWLGIAELKLLLDVIMYTFLCSYHFAY
ncbi:hypothetical protein K461DRAFT_271369 [Myriangium duriaei CBS 260.36]|uniref:Uncharacterized protein n=1 Tax=Myriangium duriaei CBS 260.36 TaxID=1168546 RepID=A0A9P4MD20_9PEZI|nr:hypothetical protein K461DRAFT_271369 [Myriangium duriaei CBS 260.36]